MGLKEEIFEQPETLQRLLDTQTAHVERIVRAIRQREVNYVFLAARGTSDHAGLYAKYLWGVFNQLPMALAAPSLFSIYGRPPALKNGLVVGISQSGQSPDIVGVLAEGNRQAAPTLAITNDPDSPLAQAAEFVIDIGAGTEEAVAATKTYTAQLLAIAMLSAALDEDADRMAALRRAPEWVAQALALDATIERVAERYRYMDQCVVLGRGYNYATAFEWSLKLKELTYVVAGPYSSADFQHGPIAIVGQGFPVLAVAPSGAVYADMLALLRRLTVEHQAELLVISDEEEALALGRTSLRLPGGVPEWLSPVVSIAPAQLFCYHLTRAKGYDPEAPRGLSKVTLTH
ncbi:MAG: glucosamine--fructose-6-phosphate aminotransferase [Chloroflexi bacterium]|nr:MAG: glucosamine--fructose-6-phosphate aminotransferase [Anaerolineaceae bacterium 4572_32.2]RLC74714.1 MAG: glucosamine--fructose-6-phosphate aminotransferase [Chloroflexota bacterium]RLC84290.1 MAG: glucosamine--fructose-6-phosphate aminotransferase [Chloroflexota bacterium]HEY73628.1 SIS domain-containing protein [Thermoflexia bacterium]